MATNELKNQRRTRRKEREREGAQRRAGVTIETFVRCISLFSLSLSPLPPFHSFSPSLSVSFRDLFPSLHRARSMRGPYLLVLAFLPTPHEAPFTRFTRPPNFLDLLHPPNRVRDEKNVFNRILSFYLSPRFFNNVSIFYSIDDLFIIGNKAKLVRKDEACRAYSQAYSLRDIRARVDEAPEHRRTESLGCVVQRAAEASRYVAREKLLDRDLGMSRSSSMKNDRVVYSIGRVTDSSIDANDRVRASVLLVTSLRESGMCGEHR